MPLPWFIFVIVKCKNGVTERQIGDSFSVKTPTKMTDVIIAIDQIKENEVIYKDLVHPLVQQLNSELHAKGIRWGINKNTNNPFFAN